MSRDKMREENDIDWREIADELAEAIRFTREYVGEHMLPAVAGWSWYDAIEAYNSAVSIADSVEKTELIDYDWQRIVVSAVSKQKRLHDYLQPTSADFPRGKPPEKKAEKEKLPQIWCYVDDCPAVICNGPHREIETTLGIEALRDDQEPIGKPLNNEKEN